MDDKQLRQWKPKLERFLGRYTVRFGHANNLGHARQLVHGLLDGSDRRNVENIAEAVEGGVVRTLQKFISQGAWEDKGAIGELRSQIGDGTNSVCGRCCSWSCSSRFSASSLSAPIGSSRSRLDRRVLIGGIAGRIVAGKRLGFVQGAVFDHPVSLDCRPRLHLPSFSRSLFLLGGVVYINEDIAHGASVDLRQTVLEEVAHYLTQVNDCTRDLQDWAFKLAVRLAMAAGDGVRRGVAC